VNPIMSVRVDAVCMLPAANVCLEGTLDGGRTSEGDENVRNWHLLSGEYPPMHGGVADHSLLLALELAKMGKRVHVWCRGALERDVRESTNVVVERIASGFGRRGLAALENALNRAAAPRTLLVQYAPHSFGWKGMNLPLCRWIRGRRKKGDDVRVLFHEVAFPFVRRPLHHNILALVQRRMAKVVLQAASQVYVTTPAWEPILRWLGWQGECTWLPAPSNVPKGDVVEAEVVRHRLCSDGLRRLVGHFGTYGGGIVARLVPVVRRLLQTHPNVRFLFLGRGGDAFLRSHPDLQSHASAVENLNARDLAAHIRSCDLMLQPYPDGVNGRRTSLMACLINGRPTVGNFSRHSESIWKEGGVALAGDDPGDFAAVAAELLDNGDWRAQLGNAGAELYERRFSIRHVVDRLLNTDATA
jgi:glycosyltransferase involved in cell wall biosynthesis